MHREHPQDQTGLRSGWCMPLMIEPLVFRPNDKAGGYMVDGDFDKILPLVAPGGGPARISSRPIRPTT